MVDNYRLQNTGYGAGGFLCPPGHPNHTYAVRIYNGPHGRVEQGSMAVTSAATEEHVPEAVRAAAQRLLDNATLVESERWVRAVYGYFVNSYVPESGSRNAADLVRDSAGSLPVERHAAVACIRQYFPEHTPRVDLIADPGTGYGSHPCTKCGQRVQYEARFDALCVVTTRVDGGGLTHCPEGGSHDVAT